MPKSLEQVESAIDALFEEVRGLIYNHESDELRAFHLPRCEHALDAWNAPPSQEPQTDSVGPHSCRKPECKRCEKLPGKACGDDDCNCFAAGNHGVQEEPQPSSEPYKITREEALNIFESLTGWRYISTFKSDQAFYAAFVAALSNAGIVIEVEPAVPQPQEDKLCARCGKAYDYWYGLLLSSFTLDKAEDFHDFVPPSQSTGEAPVNEEKCVYPNCGKERCHRRHTYGDVLESLSHHHFVPAPRGSSGVEKGEKA